MAETYGGMALLGDLAWVNGFSTFAFVGWKAAVSAASDLRHPVLLVETKDYQLKRTRLCQTPAVGLPLKPSTVWKTLWHGAF